MTEAVPVQAEKMAEASSLSVEMAPMEGITTAIFRRVYAKWFDGIDRAYTPFLVANGTHKFKNREKQEYSPFTEHLIPQILTDRAEHFLWAAGELQKAGYREVNLNAGCPSATVTTKGKGAGMLEDPEKLRAFFDEIFNSKNPDKLPQISVKMRVGVSSYDEAEKLADIYEGLPISKLIVHPRIRDDLYNNVPNLDAFRVFYEKIPHEKLVYNGDLKTTGDVEKITKLFPGLQSVMIGRGLLADPFLPSKLHGEYNKNGGGSKILAGFLDELYDEYKKIMSDERSVLFKMKDIWNFMSASFPENSKQIKAIKKSKNGMEYKMSVRELLKL